MRVFQKLSRSEAHMPEASKGARAEELARTVPGRQRERVSGLAGKGTLRYKGKRSR